MKYLIAALVKKGMPSHPQKLGYIEIVYGLCRAGIMLYIGVYGGYWS